MPYAMIPIYTQTVGAGGVASVTFNNIPSIYTDLMIQVSGRTTATDTGNHTQLVMYVNGEGYPATVSSFTQVEGNSTTATSARDSGQYIRCGYLDSATATANTFSSNTIYIPNYTASSFKQIIIDAVTENNSSATDSVKLQLNAGLWRNTAAIHRIMLDCGRTIAQYSTFTLYGIKKS